MWEGHVLAEGGGPARGYSLVWSGPGIRTFTATGDRPVQENEPTLLEIWVCVDGYWCDHTKNVCPGELTPEYDRLLDQLLERLRRGHRPRPRRREPARARPARPAAHRRRRLPRPAVPSRLPRRRRPRTRASLRAPGRIGHDPRRHGARDRAWHLLGGRRRPATRGQLPDHRRWPGEAVPTTRTISDDRDRSPRGRAGGRDRRGAPRTPAAHVGPRRGRTAKSGSCRAAG